MSYRSGISLIGNTSRTWVYPVLLAVLGDRQVIVTQAVVSGVAIITLAVAIGSTVDDPRVRYAVMAVVSAFGLAPLLTAWGGDLDGIARCVVDRAPHCCPDLERVPWWAFCTLFTVWLF